MEVVALRGVRKNFWLEGVDRKIKIGDLESVYASGPGLALETWLYDHPPAEIYIVLKVVANGEVSGPAPTVVSAPLRNQSSESGVT